MGERGDGGRLLRCRKREVDASSLVPRRGGRIGRDRAA